MFSDCEFELSGDGKARCIHCEFCVTPPDPARVKYLRYKCAAAECRTANLVERIVAIAVDSGAVEESVREFVRRKHAPPNCYEKKRWWLKHFEEEFGAKAASAVGAAVIGQNATQFVDVLGDGI